MRRFLAVVLLTAAASAALPTVADARPRQECRRVWVHGHYVRRCRPLPPPRHHHHRPPPRHRPPPHRY